MKEEDIVKRSVTMIVLFPGTGTGLLVSIFVLQCITYYVEVFKHHGSSFHSNEYGYIWVFNSLGIFKFLFIAFATFRSIGTEIFFD